MKSDKKIVVLYHNRCHDGFAAAWVAHKKFGTRAEYIGVDHSDPPPEGLKNKDVYMLDFSYEAEDTKKIKDIVKSLTIIDHHESVEKSTKLAHHYLYSPNKRSGSALAWQYFYPHKSTPRWILYIQDLDLWRKKMKYTEEARATLNSYPYDFKIWDKLFREFENAKLRKKYIEKGKDIMAFQRRAVTKIVDNAELVTFCGYKTLVANTQTFVDEVGSALVRKLPPIGIIWSYRRDKLIVSLRSDGSIDVSKLAARFDGGGHKVSSAFVMPAYKKFPWKSIKK